MARKFVLWGASGHAKVVAGVIKRSGGEVAATIDAAVDVPPILGVSAYRGKDAFDRWLTTVNSVSAYTGVICIGGSKGDERLKVLGRMRAAGLDLTPLVDPQAFVDDTAILGDAAQVLPGAVVAAGASIGPGSIVNHNASIDHESFTAEGVHIAPGATICGLVKIGKCAFVGAGSVVLPRLSIGEYVCVGAGSVVTRDVSSTITVCGNPAKPLSGR